MPTSTLLRSDVATLTALAADDLAPLWGKAETATQLEAPLHDIVPPLVDEYGAAAATAAAYWYDETREEQAARGWFGAIPADVPPGGGHDLVRWALSEVSDPTQVVAFRTLIEGGMQRRIANYSRLTVSGSAVADPAARGWQRVGTPRCDFCRMLIGRGAVYTEASVHFDAHDHCNCAAAPAWR
jgi:hypothetical protein